MVRLKAKPFEEFSHKVADGKTKAAFKMRDEYDVFAELRFWRYLGVGSPACHTLRDSATLI